MTLGKGKYVLFILDFLDILTPRIYLVLELTCLYEGTFPYTNFATEHFVTAHRQVWLLSVILLSEGCFTTWVLVIIRCSHFLRQLMQI